jgi:hypothetical protein
VSPRLALPLSLCLAVILGSCQAPQALYLADEAWRALAPEASQAVSGRIKRAGYDCRSKTLALKECPSALYSAAEAYKGKVIVLDPLFGREAEKLADLLPAKKFVALGFTPSAAKPNLFTASTDFSSGARRLGALAAYLPIHQPEASSSLNSRKKQVEPEYAAVVASSDPADDLLINAFSEGYAAEGGKAERLKVLRVDGSDQGLGQANREIFALNTRFVFITRPSFLRAFLQSPAPRSCVLAGIRVSAYQDAYPSLRVSLEDDWPALAEAALGALKKPKAGGLSLAPRVTRLKGDVSRIFTKKSKAAPILFGPRYR